MDINKHYKIGSGRTVLQAHLQNTGRGLNVLLTGGDSPHIGGVVLALPRPSLRGDGSISADSYIIPVPGHKDQLLAQPMAEALASATGLPCVVTAGVHSDAMTTEEIADCFQTLKRLTQILLEDL